MSEFVKEFTKKIVSVQPMQNIDMGLVMEEQFPGILTPKILAEREALARIDNDKTKRTE